MRMWALAFPAIFLCFAACQTTEANKSGPPAATDASASPSPSPSAPAPEGPKPRCATQDCKTKKIIDDGCVDDGHGGRLCASCVNMCP